MTTQNKFAQQNKIPHKIVGTNQDYNYSVRWFFSTDVEDWHKKSDNGNDRSPDESKKYMRKRKKYNIK